MALRALFMSAADPELRYPVRAAVGPLRAELRAVAAEGPTLSTVDELRQEAARWASAEVRRYQALLARAGDPATRQVLARRAALGCAPLALRSGAWLQWLSGPGNADDPVALAILAVYASDVGVGHPRASRGDVYSGLLRHLRVAEHAVPAAQIALDQRIDDRACYLPAVLLAMSRRPDDLRDEILGADLCLRTVGLLPALTLVRQVLPTAVDWVAIDPGAARGVGMPSDAVRCAAAVEAAGAGEPVVLGFRWALAALRQWSGELHAELDAARDPAFEMAELLRWRAAEGAVYHQHVKLDGRPLSAWLRDCRADPRPMLRALAGSRLVKPGRSGASALLTVLVGDRGPMFRVFAPEQVGVIRRWIDSLSSAVDGPPPGTDPLPGTDPPPSPARPATPGLAALADAPPDPGRPPADLRAAYHLLQQRTDTVALRGFALDYVRGWLARSAHGIDTAPHQLPPQWGPEGLRPWLAAQHERHDREFEELARRPVPARNELIDSTVQLAPLTLIDGAWLQGFTDYDHASSETGFPLFETYWDELGNGEPVLNHPLIYREVLAEMGMRPPPTRSAEFAYWPSFRDASFELPVYWLCIGRFPRAFQPEVLGLNVAMELSGVGGSYRQAHIALKTYGFSTRFVDIHNTIDNVAAGHSAWAADAVDTYMTSLDARERAEVWHRIRVGYRSLNPQAGWRARRAQRRARRRGTG